MLRHQSLRWRAAALALGALLAVACHRESPAVRTSIGTPVILISVDTLRSDHLPVYGYAGVKTPAIDALAADGVVFERAYSNVPLTLPSHTSILTGLLPQEHGVRNNIGYILDRTKHPTIAALLHDAGYTTGGFISSYVLRGNAGLSSGFDVYDDAIGTEAGAALGRLQRPGAATLSVARAWVDQAREKPFFLFFHIYEPHGPYEAPEPFRSQVANPYDAEIAASDDVVGKLVASLKADGVYDKALILFLSDHGEGLGDHGEAEHGVFLYREALQVPLIVKLPNGERKGDRVRAPVELIDIVPTIASVTGAKLPPGSRGINLLDANALAAPRSLYAETLYPRIHLGWSELRSLMEDRHHFIEAPKPELYDVVADPAESANVLGEQRRVYASIRAKLDTFGKEIVAPQNVDPDEAAKLAALGYLGSVKSTEGPLPDPKDRIGDLGELQSASRLAAEGKQREAIATLRRVLDANPKFSDAWAKLGNVYEEMGRDEDAISAYREGIKASPATAAEFALSMTALFLKANRLDDARKHAELALERNPAGAHQFLARIALASGDLTTAEREATAAMIDEVAKSNATVTIAQVRVRQGRLPDAARMLEELRRDAAGRGTRVEHLELALGDVYARMDRYPEAEQAFRREIAAFPAELNAYASLSVVLAVQKKYDDIDPLFASMTSRNPNRRAYLVAAKSYEVLGDARTAAQWRTRADRLK
jgi:arylsulfatase A-like enzyme/cytochrome c-type biogenesis protein CcmH/NrfG